ncbi:ribonuclease E activity regulator RraA [Pseudomonas sp. S1_E04]
MDFSTADLCDQHEAMVRSGDVRVLPGQWAWFGTVRRCQGHIVTLQAQGCNGDLRALLGEAGNGRVLVVDAGLDPLALLGENLAALARRNGWAGVLIHGNVRDVRALAGIELGVIATGRWPVRSSNDRGGGVRAVLSLAGTRVSSGEWLYADEDGVLVSRRPLHPQPCS